jgi:hypothetical protein
MNIDDLQRRLAALGCYAGKLDGVYGPVTRAAILKALTDGPDYALDEQGVDDAVRQLPGATEAHIWASWDCECTGAPFIDGRSAILYEPHRFSKATGHRFDASHPHISSPTWNRRLYPGSQQGRWDQLLEAVGLDVDAGFASASYGGFQILGENHFLCDAATSWDFAWRQAQTADDQLYAYVMFVKNAHLTAKLAACKPNDPVSCRPFCMGYNCTAERENNYEGRFAAALARRMKT